MKGCICLDLDGTVTADPFTIPTPVIEYFQSLHQEGWVFLFSTGRPYAFAIRLFQEFPFPFFLSLQNGADLLSMPEQKLLRKEHVPVRFLSSLEAVYREMEEDFLLYAGFEKGDFCYYRPHRFSQKMLVHLKRVQSLVPAPWQPQQEFLFSEKEAFPLIKALGTLEQMEFLQQKLRPFSEIQTSVIEDPLARGSVYLTLITGAKATKGESLRRLKEHLGADMFCIAAGDDHNDIPMFEEADFSVVMQTAPSSLHAYADLLAEPACCLGIIEALKKATREVGSWTKR